MENVIISQNKHWKKAYSDLYPRKITDKLIKQLSLKHIQVLQGVRRSGKSTIFKILINHISKKIDPKEILYINMDDPFFIQYSNNPTVFYNIIQNAEKLTQKKFRYLFLDEVQIIEGWESYVKSVYDSEIFDKIFVTGSNSSFLNGSLSTLLSGRYISDQVYPLSFSEILKIEGINDTLTLYENLPKALNIIDDMIRYGSFIEVYEAKKDFKRDILKTYYDTILLKDCVANGGIRDVKSFKELSVYLLSNISSLYSYSSLSKALGINDKSVKEYISYLEDSFLFSEIKLFSYSLKEQTNNKKKIYISDNGFLELSFGFSSNYGKLLENLVFSELQKKGYEIYFYNKNFECDFIVKNDKKLLAVQVCYELSEFNKNREIKALKKLPFKVEEKIIITYNQKEQIDKEIQAVPFWEYFSKQS